MTYRENYPLNMLSEQGKTMSIENRINSEIISHLELIEVTEEIHKLPKEDRDFEGRALLLIKMFSGEPDKAMAIDLRLKAMSKIIDSNELPGWAMPKQPDGSRVVSEPVWQAAAEEPLVFLEKEIIFDKQKFLDRILSCAEPEGVA